MKTFALKFGLNLSKFEALNLSKFDALNLSKFSVLILAKFNALNFDKSYFLAQNLGDFKEA